MNPEPTQPENVYVQRSFDESWRRLKTKLLSGIVRGNPVYLLSALLMIAGIDGVLRPEDQTVGNVHSILATFITLEVYEVLLIAIAVFLVCFRKVMDDGATVVLIESLFAVGCFMVLDEITFNWQRIGLGTQLGVVATLLAAARFTVLKGTMPRLLPTPVLAFLVLAFVWNGVVPGAIAEFVKNINERRDPAWVAGWWSLAALGAFLAVLASMERGRLWPKQTVFLRAPLAKWVICALVLLASGLHHFAIGWAMDVRLYTCDVVPFAVALCAIAACLLAATRERAGVLEHVVGAAPILLCVIVALSGSFVVLPESGEPTRSLLERIAASPRALNSPTAWLVAIAGLSGLHAFRRRSVSLAHLAAAAVLFCVLLWGYHPESNPEFGFRAFRVTLALLLLASAVVYRSPSRAAGALALIDYEIWKLLPERAVHGIWLHPAAAMMAMIGLSFFTLWAVFQHRLPARLAHFSALLVFGSVLWINADAASQPVWLVSVLTAMFGLLFALAAWSFRWNSYYVLAFLSLSLTPTKPIRESGDAIDSPNGWLLIVASFIALALGVLVSNWKARRGIAPAGPEPPGP